MGAHEVIRIFTALRFLAWPVMIVLAWLTGRRGAKRDAALKDAQAHIKTRRQMDEALETLGDDPAVLREWMRERGQQ